MTPTSWSRRGGYKRKHRCANYFWSPDVLQDHRRPLLLRPSSSAMALLSFVKERHPGHGACPSSARANVPYFVFFARHLRPSSGTEPPPSLLYSDSPVKVPALVQLEPGTCGFIPLQIRNFWRLDFINSMYQLGIFLVFFYFIFWFIIVEKQ